MEKEVNTEKSVENPREENVANIEKSKEKASNIIDLIKKV